MATECYLLGFNLQGEQLHSKLKAEAAEGDHGTQFTCFSVLPSVFECFDVKLMTPIGSELLHHGASVLPESLPITQLLSDCSFGVSNKLSLSQLGLVLGSSLSLGKQEGCVHLSSCLCSFS